MGSSKEMGTGAQRGEPGWPSAGAGPHPREPSHLPGQPLSSSVHEPLCCSGAECTPWALRRPSLYPMSWSPNSWATRPRSAPLSPWSRGAASSTAPSGFGSHSLPPGRITRGTAGRETPPACGCSAASLVSGAPALPCLLGGSSFHAHLGRREDTELGSDGLRAGMRSCV